VFPCCVCIPTTSLYRMRLHILAPQMGCISRLRPCGSLAPPWWQAESLTVSYYTALYCTVLYCIVSVTALPAPCILLLVCRTLDLYTSAVLEAVCDPPSGPAPEWRQMMAQLSRDSCEVRDAYHVSGVLGGGLGAWGACAHEVAGCELRQVMTQLSRDSCAVRDSSFWWSYMGFLGGGDGRLRRMRPRGGVSGGR
jgi:hypothetical protein